MGTKNDAVRLIALDIDSTLTNRVSEISPRNRRAIRLAQEQGVFVTLATGRCTPAARPLWTTLDVHCPVILYGGAITTDPKTGEVVSAHTMEPAVVRDVLAYAHELGLDAQIYLDDTVIYETPNQHSQGYIERQHLPSRMDAELRTRLYTNVPKVLVFCDTQKDETLEAFRARFDGICEVSRSMPEYIEVNRLHTTKGTALMQLAKLLGIRRESVAAIGDNYLDQDMIEWAGYGVCVANGSEAVRASADVIAPACDEDGVAWFIENYVLENT